MPCTTPTPCACKDVTTDKKITQITQEDCTRENIACVATSYINHLYEQMYEKMDHGHRSYLQLEKYAVRLGHLIDAYQSGCAETQIKEMLYHKITHLIFTGPCR
jgi:hypothetical protein